MAHPVAHKASAVKMREVVIHEVVPGVEARVHGSLSVRTSAHVRAAFSHLIASGQGDILIHLEAAEVWDATGLGVLVGAHHRAARCGRRLVVADASPRLCRLMRATKLDRVITVDDEMPSFVRLAASA